MKPTTTSENQISVLAAPEGLLIFQGFYQQALFILRSDEARFVLNPEDTRLLVIPPFAALSLNCYLALESVDSINLEQDIALGDDFTLTVLGKGTKTIRYYSNHSTLPGPRSLRADGIQVVATPRLTALVHTDESEPRLSVITQFPEAEEPNYALRFAHAPRLLAHAVARVVAQSSKRRSHE